MTDHAYIYDGRVHQIGPVIEALGDSFNYTLMIINNKTQLVFRSPIGLLNRGRHLIAFAARDVENIKYEPDTLRVVQQQNIPVHTCTAQAVLADVDGYHQNESLWFAGLYRDLDLDHMLDGDWDDRDDGAQTDMADNAKNLPGLDRSDKVSFQPAPRRGFAQPPTFPTDIKLLGSYLTRPAPPVQMMRNPSGALVAPFLPMARLGTVDTETQKTFLGRGKRCLTTTAPVFGNVGIGPSQTLGLDPPAQALRSTSGPPPSHHSRTSIKSGGIDVLQSASPSSVFSGTATLAGSSSPAPTQAWHHQAPAANFMRPASGLATSRGINQLASRHSDMKWTPAADTLSFAYAPASNISGLGWNGEPFDLTPYTHTLIERLPIRSSADLDKLGSSWFLTLNKFITTESDLRASLMRLVLRASTRNLLTETMMKEIYEREDCLGYIRNFLSRRDAQTVGFQLDVERVKRMYNAMGYEQASAAGCHPCLVWVKQRLVSNALMYQELEKVNVTKVAREEYLNGMSL